MFCVQFFFKFLLKLGRLLLSMQEVKVNLIITDYCMPGMTGYDLLTRVKVNPTPNLHVTCFSFYYWSMVCIVFTCEFPNESKNNIAEFVALFCRNHRGKTFQSWSCPRKTCLPESTGKQGKIKNKISNYWICMGVWI